MKRVIVFMCAVMVTACTSTPTTKFSGAPGCQTKSSITKGQSVSTDFCMRKITFKPSQYLVKVNDQTVFQGTDYERVAFEKQIREGRVTGGCDANILIQDMKTERPVALSNLPEELISGCQISSNSNGSTRPFKKDIACDKVFYTHLKPMLGKVFPLEVSRQCIVRLNNEVVFDGTFNF